MSTVPRPVSRGLRAMLVVRRAQRRQWPTAIRTSVSVAGPVMVGWLVGDFGAGLLVALGGFVALYGGGRPFVNRARLLIVIAVAQAGAVSLGIWAQASPWAGVAAVTVIAVVSTWLCNAFNIQPGAYQIALSCAAGATLHAEGADPLHTGMLVLVGGLVACLVSLAGALVDPRGPEREAVEAAAEAVARFFEAIDVVETARLEGREPDAVDDAWPQLDVLRHQASVAMHHAWVVLVNQQPARGRRSAGLLRLQEISRQLQLLLADRVLRHRPEPDAAQRVRRLGRQAGHHRGEGSGRTLPALPLGRPSAASMLRNAVRPQSRSLLVIGRVGVASLVAGAIGVVLGLSHSYWAVAAAVLVLSQGFDQRRTVQRGLERTFGTFVGLGLSALALAAAGPGPVLVAMVAVALFCTQLLVLRNYAAAAVFITCSALLMSGVGLSAADTATLIRARGLDTAVGCLVAIVVFAVLSRKTAAGWLPTALGQTLEAAAEATDQLTPDRVSAPPGLAARRDLQRRVIQLGESFENGLNGFAAQRTEADRLWPAVASAERLAYRVLAEGWRLEEAAGTSRGATVAEPVAEPPPSQGLRSLGAAAWLEVPPGPVRDVPAFLSRDVADLRQALRRVFTPVPTRPADQAE